jgi:hypothetical protein
MVNGNRFTWGQSVRVSDKAPNDYRPGQYASVCGIREIARDDPSMPHEPIGTPMYIIEFSDGSSIEVPEQLLEEFER